MSTAVSSAPVWTPAARIARMAPWLLWAVFAIAVDQLTKAWILQNYQLGDGSVVTGFFNIVRAHNTGAAFSFLRDASGWQRWVFVGIAIGATVFILWQMYKHPAQKLMAFALAGILGGAIGNVVDRLVHGYVVDFLDFHWGAAHFPAFNMADSAITLGAICLVLDEVRRMRRAKTGA
jgi:signal peptidase II